MRTDFNFSNDSSSYRPLAQKTSLEMGQKTAKEQLAHIKTDVQKRFHIEVMGKNVGDMIKDVENIAEIPVLKAKANVEDVEEKQQALRELKAKTSVIMHTAKCFNGVNLENLTQSGVFSNPYAQILSGPTSAMSIVVQPNAVPDQFNVTINQVATQDNVLASTAAATDLNTPLSWNGTLILNNQNIELSPSLSLSAVQSLINSFSSTTNVTANLINTNSGYVLSFKALNMAQPISVDVSGVTGAAAGQLPPTSLKTVTDLSAQVIFRNPDPSNAGATQYLVKTYPTNSITDQVTGVIFNLIPNNPALYPANMVVSIQNNLTAPTQLLLGTDPDHIPMSDNFDFNPEAGFVYNWNKFIDYIKSKDCYQGTLTIDLKNALKTAFSASTADILSTQLNTLRSIGITLDVEGHMQVDQDLWANSLISNFQQVAKVLGFSATSSNSAFELFKHPKVIDSSLLGQPINVTLAADQNGNLNALMMVGTTPYSATVSQVYGNTVVISGPVNSILQDVKFTFDAVNQIPNGGSASTVLTMTQGCFDALAGMLQTRFLEAPTTPPGEQNSIPSYFDAEHSSLEQLKKDKETLVKNAEERKKAKIARETQKFQRLETMSKELQRVNQFIRTSLLMAAGNKY